ncbi:MAG TPA: hypothetical protein VM056_06310 [Terriglobales bacterium]|nr:hypothetical protein [Terriglobales bacterium]
MADQKLTYVSFLGIPLTFTLDWPFHQSAGGADYFVLHGNAVLEDGSDRHAALSIHMSQVVKEALPSLEPKDSLAPAINAVRKATDTKDIEFIKSTKRQPMALSSRAFSIMTRQFTFQNPNAEQLLEFLKRKVYWSHKLGQNSVRMDDPVEALYLTRTTEDLMVAAKSLASDGFIKLDGVMATATELLTKQASTFEIAMSKALADIEAKHEFERA